MNIIYSTDDNYSKMCYASINSLFEANKGVEKLYVYIINNNINKNMINKFNDLAKEYKRIITYISCYKICKNLVKKNDFSISAYARLFIQDEILEDKAIYIDCDTFVNKDLTELWNIKLDNYWVAGVIDPLPQYLKVAVGMKKDDLYVNSGVLLINLKKWRDIDFRKKTINYIEEHNYNVVHHDQGIINGICNNHILFIHPKYNLMPEFIYMNENKIKRLYNYKYFYSNNELIDANNLPYIVHFISKFYNRPWYVECSHPYKDKFQKYYLKIAETLDSKPLDKKTSIRKFVYKKFPFAIYLFIEKILDIKRKNSI